MRVMRVPGTSAFDRMVTLARAIVLGGGTLFIALGYSPSSEARITAYEGARIIVGNGHAIEVGTMLVDGAVILEAGRTVDVRVPLGARRVDLSGKTIMPAIIDTHVHVNQTREALAQDLKHLAYFGVGTVLSLGVDTGEAPFTMRAEPLPGAARLLTAGRGITAPEPGRETAPYWVTTEAEARKAVQENAARNVDIIKVWVDDRNDRYEKLTPDLYGAIVTEAHNLGLQVTAHAVELEDAEGLMRAGVDAFAHSIRDREIDAAFIMLAEQHPRLVLCPNLISRGTETRISWLQGILPAAELRELESENDDRPNAEAIFSIQARNLMKMHEAGVRIVLGTDTSFDLPGGNTPWASHIEMEDMVAAGMTPMQVIMSATRNAAEFLKLPYVGTLEAGKYADFIVLNGDPLDDITNTRRIASVYLRGKYLDRDEYP